MLLMPGLQLSGVGRSYGLSPGLEILPAGKSALRRQRVCPCWSHDSNATLRARRSQDEKSIFMPFPLPAILESISVLKFCC